MGSLQVLPSSLSSAVLSISGSSNFVGRRTYSISRAVATLCSWRLGWRLNCQGPLCRVRGMKRARLRALLAVLAYCVAISAPLGRAASGIEHARIGGRDYGRLTD